MSQEKLNVFQKTCKTCIDKAQEEFKNHRGFFHKEFNQIIRGILGVIAALTIIPALIVAMKSKNGYTGTFFKQPTTNSYAELEKLEEDIKIKIDEVNNNSKGT